MGQDKNYYVTPKSLYQDTNGNIGSKNIEKDYRDDVLPVRTMVFTRKNAETNEMSFFVAADEEITRADEIIESIKNNDQFKEATTVTLYYVKTERLDIFSGNLDLMGCFLEEYREINPLLYLNDYMQKLINNVLILQLK